ncbi:MAG: 12-oxophytodienoate reductase, partial [Rhodococcus sp. (in: high G+C Gram-positive bacteria)]|nr:12-oxophytodienoate reductase [Rhodococcus sp. (in: high G+C Gram-positive bacteria)]
MTNPLFQPLRIRSLELSNRIVMSPMTRTYSIEGVPGRDVADYYRRRAEGGTGLIVTEGVAIDHETAVDHANVPNLHTPAAQAGWRKVVDDVHAAGGKIVPQLWHVGPLWGAMTQMDPSLKPMRPSGEWGPLGVTSYSAAYVE